MYVAIKEDRIKMDVERISEIQFLWKRVNNGKKRLIALDYLLN